MKKISGYHLTAASFVFFFSCNPETKVESLSIGQKADDASAKAEYDRVNDDIELVLRSENYENNARAESGNNVNLPCGRVTLDKSNFTLNYQGQNCFRKVLSGSVEVKLVNGNNFSEKDAKLEVTYKDYKVYYGATQSSITYSGKQYITNVSGGRLSNLFKNQPDTVIHQIRALNMTVKYDSASTTTKSRDWNVARKKTFITNGLATGITFELDGDTAFLFDSQSFTKITEWGKNKEDKDFINYVNVPFKWENCGINFTGPYVLKNGKVSHYSYTTSIIGKYVGTFTAEAGYKLSDNKVTKVNNCDSDGYKLDWGLKLNDNQIWSLNDQFQYY